MSHPPLKEAPILVDKLGVGSFMLSSEKYQLDIPLLAHFAEETSAPQPAKIFYEDEKIVVFTIAQDGMHVGCALQSYLFVIPFILF
jgi:hypothetical protein